MPMTASRLWNQFIVGLDGQGVPLTAKSATGQQLLMGFYCCRSDSKTTPGLVTIPALCPITGPCCIFFPVTASITVRADTRGDTRMKDLNFRL